VILAVMLLGALGTLWPLRGLAELAREGFLRRANFRGELVPTGMGVSFLLGSSLGLVGGLWLGVYGIQDALLLTTVLFGFGFLGLVDDLWGDHAHRGIGGHLRVALQGKVSTGLLKAVYGGLLALGAALFSGGKEGLLVNALIIALTTNTLNLLDLRPGRCGKAFLLGSLLLFCIGETSALRQLLPVIGGVLAYLPWDMRRVVMMGDAGANPLGALLGIGIIGLAGPMRAFSLLLLIGIHLYSEKYSLSRLIDDNPVLRFLDKLGCD
jgi:UDP-GlcNAc:undecaprenyl-phosphate GlcNAc-1-phosphate transferase